MYFFKMYVDHQNNIGHDSRASHPPVALATPSGREVRKPTSLMRPRLLGYSPGRVQIGLIFQMTR